MPSNITGKLYLGDILLSTGAGVEDCGACIEVGINGSYITYENSNINYSFNTFDSTTAFDNANINYNITVDSNFNRFDPNNTLYQFSVYSGSIVDP